MTKSILVFFGLQRFAHVTAPQLKRYLGISDESQSRWIVLGHTWDSSDGITSPWVDASTIPIGSKLDFEHNWGQLAVLQQERFDDALQISSLSQDQESYAGFESRASTQRMLLSIERALSIARVAPHYRELQIVLTRSDFFPLGIMSNSDCHGQGVRYLNLRRNGGFCDWFLMGAGKSLEALSEVGTDYLRLADSCRSFAGEDVLEQAFGEHGVALNASRGGGFLLRDHKMKDKRFGRFPREAVFFPSWAMHDTQMIMLNFADSIARRLKNVPILRSTAMKPGREK